jgi:hypothetical protein
VNIEVWRIPNSREYTLLLTNGAKPMVRVDGGWIVYRNTPDVSRRMIRWHSVKDATAAMKRIPQ